MLFTPKDDNTTLYLYAIGYVYYLLLLDDSDCMWIESSYGYNVSMLLISVSPHLFHNTFYSTLDKFDTCLCLAIALVIV